MKEELWPKNRDILDDYGLARECLNKEVGRSHNVDSLAIETEVDLTDLGGQMELIPFP